MKGKDVKVIGIVGGDKTIFNAVMATEMAKNSNLVLVDFTEPQPNPPASFTISNLEFDVKLSPFAQSEIIPINRYATSTGESTPKTCFEICQQLNLTNLKTLGNEYKLIQQKKSKLSAKQRAAVVEACQNLLVGNKTRF